MCLPCVDAYQLVGVSVGCVVEETEVDGANSRDEADQGDHGEPYAALAYDFAKICEIRVVKIMIFGFTYKLLQVMHTYRIF